MSGGSKLGTYCVDCRHYQAFGQNCHAPQLGTTPDDVHGPQQVHKDAYAMRRRSIVGALRCGPGGAWFEAKEAPRPPIASDALPAFPAAALGATAPQETIPS